MAIAWAFSSSSDRDAIGYLTIGLNGVCGVLWIRNRGEGSMLSETFAELLSSSIFNFN